MKKVIKALAAHSKLIAKRLAVVRHEHFRNNIISVGILRSQIPGGLWLKRIIMVGL